MTALIAELEQAREGSWALDHRIGDAVGAEQKYQPGRCMGDDPCHLPYTTSLDAALTLVPEEWGGCVFLNGVANLTLNPPNLGEICNSLARNETPRFPDLRAVGAADSGSPALALCIAALKAREQADD